MMIPILAMAALLRIQGTIPSLIVNLHGDNVKRERMPRRTVKSFGDTLFIRESEDAMVYQYRIVENP